MTETEMDVVAGPLSLIPPGEGRTFSVGGVRIAIFHTRDGGVFATQADCPHRGGPLADGLTGGGMVVCPLHSWKFDLQTGFYFGTGFVSYGLTILISGLTFVIWWFAIGMGINDNRIWWWLGLNAALLLLLQPPIQRLARSIWIALFVGYDANWKKGELIA